MFGERLAEARKDCSLRQEDLAARLNVSKYTVSSWEQGKSMPTLDTLVKISELLNASTDYLLGIIHWDPGFEYNRQQDKFTPDELQKIKEYEQFLLFQRQQKRKSSKD